jgi:hypothetical protein
VFSQTGDLPWRETRDPYAILVSRSCQQVQVARVVPISGGSSAGRRSRRSPPRRRGRDPEWQGLATAAAPQPAPRGLPSRGGGGPPTATSSRVGRYTADAVARFALGRPVLGRCERAPCSRPTQGSFGPLAHALMDLRRQSVCRFPLRRMSASPRVPVTGKRYEPLRKQGRLKARSASDEPGAPPVAETSQAPPARRRGGRRAGGRRARSGSRRARHAPAVDGWIIQTFGSM